MDGQTIVHALILGIVEGLTEFIPVSSTGHILLLGHFLGFESTGKTFEVLIQLGAILAILSVYFGRLWSLFITLPSDPTSRRFVAGILLAFLPAAVIGVLAHGFIKEVLFESPALICSTLLIGGIILLWIDRLPLKPRYTNVMDYPLSLCLTIGFFQCLAMVPGVSRSGATIAGALLMGTDKRSAAEFSFFLAMPTMAGAFAYDLFKNRNVLSMNDAMIIAIGFVASFVAAVFVVKGLLDFVSRHGFAPFAWWRIFVGLAGFAGLYFFG
ncbi:undecaprenyl-diphosphate phosphatase [Labrenzia sp. 011]|uniref:undecaprenyl-diphosphate phosphatase n=1 Tax=Labrenzia sp. 011 TaxID=2171494 RepID=UPI000D523423|nr:undecaprenyl-diphosphate phosphatase [Labrenzia sp. 011]PVB60705.1 undecaprenyl-diphosphatase [Labrenzia sp. 011]